MAIDKADILKEVYQGAGQPAKNPIPPTIWSYSEATKDYEYNPDKAKEMLKAAGVENLETDLWWMPVSAPLQSQRQAHGRDDAVRPRQGRHQRQARLL